MKASGPAPVQPEIRPASFADVDALLALEQQAFPGNRLTRREFRDAIGSGATVTLAAGPADRPAGYIFMQTRRGTTLARITSLAVHPDHAGRGLGRRLLDAAETEARRRGCTRIRLEVRADNDRAARFYRMADYRHAEREEDYYEDGCAAERYEKTLPG